MKKMALLGVKTQPSPANGMEDNPEVGHCTLKVSGMGEEVIQVDDTVTPGDFGQDPLYKALKCGRGIAEAEGHDFKFPQPLANREGGLGACFRRQLHLPIATTKVQGAEPAGPRDVIKGVIDTG